MRWVGILNDLGFSLAAVLSELQRNRPLRPRPDLSRRGPFCIATAGGFGGGGTTFVAPGFYWASGEQLHTVVGLHEDRFHGHLNDKRRRMSFEHW